MQWLIVMATLARAGITLAPAPEMDTQGKPELLTLEGALARAERYSLDIQVAREKLASAAVLSRKAWSVLLPTVSAQATLTRNDLDKPLQIPFGGKALTLMDVWQESAVASVSWRLLNLRSLPLIDIAYDTVEVAKLGYSQLESTLLYAVQVSYYGTLHADEQVAIRTRSRDNARAHMELARARESVGQATRVDALRAEVDVAAADKALVQAHNAALIARRGLATLIGWMDDRGDVRSFSVRRPGRGPELPQPGELLDAAYRDRFDLKATRLHLQISESSKLETWAKFLPVLAAQANYQWSDTGGFIGKKTTWNASLSLQWELFSGGSTAWELSERSHDIRAAALEVEKTRRDIAQQVADARVELETAQASLTAARRQAALARETAALMNAHYEVGGATELDVLDANRMLADAEAGEGLMQLALDLATLSLQQVLWVPPAGSIAANSTRAMSSGSQTLDAGGPSGATVASGGAVGPPMGM